jgi:hypothetical protein
MRAKRSIRCSLTRQECHALPQASRWNRRDVQTAELGRAAVLGEAAAHGVLERGRLLEDFLLHEVGMAVQLGIGDIPGDLVDDRRNVLRLQRADGEILGRDVHHLAVLEVDNVLRAADNGGNIAGQHVFAVADPEDERGTLAGCNDLGGAIAAHHRDAVGALYVAEGLANRLQEATLVGRGRFLLVVVGDQVAEYLGVRLGAESVALGQKEFFDADVVLDDAVVDQRDFPVTADVWVGVCVGDSAMGGPACVANPRGAGEFECPRRLDESFHPASFLGELEAAAVLCGHPRRVIAAIFQTLESLQDDSRGLLFADVSDDAAHMGRCWVV